MKKILFILLLSASAYSQKQELFKQELKGLIEIDGHTFDNQKVKDKVIFTATIDGIEIKRLDEDSLYENRKCSKKDCRIIHLIKKTSVLLNGYNFNYITTPN